MEASGAAQASRPGRRIGLLLLALMLVASLTFGVARAGDKNVRLGAAATGPLLGITGNVARFQSQTGQASSVHHAFLGWGQGLSYGSTFAALFPTLGPIPMIHLGTEGQSAPEAITPGGIAAGQGDGYLIALNRAIAVWNKGIYVRPLAEMNNSANAWSGYLANGRPKDAAHSPATYRKAFARIYVILHGGSASAVNAKLRQLGLPPVQGGELLSNPFPRLRIVWSPLASDVPRVAGNAAELYYPGRGFVDVEGGVDLRRAPHRHGAMAGSREAVPLRTLASKAVLGAGVGALPGRRSGLRPAHVHLPEDARRHRGCGLLREPSRLALRPRVEAEEPRPLPGMRHAPRRAAPGLGAGTLRARAEGDRPEADVEPWLRAGAARRRVLGHRAPQRSDRALAAHLRRRLRDRRRRPAARNRPAPVRAGRHLRGDVATSPSSRKHPVGGNACALADPAGPRLGPHRAGKCRHRVDSAAVEAPPQGGRCSTSPHSMSRSV